MISCLSEAIPSEIIYKVVQDGFVSDAESILKISINNIIIHIQIGSRYSTLCGISNYRSNRYVSQLLYDVRIINLTTWLYILYKLNIYEFVCGVSLSLVVAFYIQNIFDNCHFDRNRYFALSLSYFIKLYEQKKISNYRTPLSNKGNVTTDQ